MKHNIGKIIIRILSACFIGYVLFSIISLRVMIIRKEKENSDMKSQVDVAQVSIEELHRVLDESKTDDLIRKFAEKQGYAYYGEKIFKDEADN